jgi:hypothetical protein
MLYWIIGFIAGGAVIFVVAVLLIGILVQASRILKLARTASEVVGQIDVNTRSVWALRATNAVAEQILAGARAIEGNATAIVNVLPNTKDARRSA